MHSKHPRQRRRYPRMWRRWDREGDRRELHWFRTVEGRSYGMPVLIHKGGKP